MIGHHEPFGEGSFFRRPLPKVSGLLALAFVLGACGGDAESREDLEGEPLPAEEVAGGEAPAQATTPQPQPERSMRALPAGSVLTFRVSEEISTSTHRSGDAFDLELAESVSGQGDFTLPAGTQAQGIVTNARASEGAEEEAVLAVRIESIHLDGRTRALNGSVIDADTESSVRDSRTRSAAKVATGTAAGALVGQILGGDTRSTVQGAAAGTVAGLGVALTTRNGHAVLPAGSRVQVRLDDDLVMN